MTAATLLRVLATVPDARDIILRGRGKRAVLSCSVLDGTVPRGWHRCLEPSMQRLEGYQRIVWDGQEDLL